VKEKIFFIALQLELMAVFWAILAVLAFQTYAMDNLPEEFWFIKYIAYVSGVISIFYFIASIVKTMRKPKCTTKTSPPDKK